MTSSAHSRVLDLLTEARRALALRTRLTGAGKDPADVDGALDGLYRDLGKAMVDAAEVDGGLLFESLRRPEKPDYELDKDESWYTDDRDDPLGPRPVAPLFEPGDLLEGGLPDSEFDESTPVIPPEREYTDSEAPADFVVATVAGLASEATSDPAAPLSLLRGSERPEWRAGLDAFVDLLELPRSFLDADELRTEATRLQWAVNELDSRLQGLPADLQIAVLALLGARAQHLRTRLDSDVGPRVLLDRLQRQRIARHLPAVAPLLPIPRPEHDSWEEDARRWLNLLRTGYSASSREAIQAPG